MGTVTRVLAVVCSVFFLACGDEEQPMMTDMAGQGGSGPAAVCGDGIVGGTEECDLGQADGSACNGPSAGDLACTAAACGDGYVNLVAGETCESPVDTAECNGVGAGLQGCTVATCGDGYLNATAGEACDDGNTVAGDGCNGRCAMMQGTPDLVVSPTVVDFGIVRTANPLEEIITVTNQGDAPVEIFGVEASGAPTFVVRAGERDVGGDAQWWADPDQDGQSGLAPGAEVTLVVVYTPTRMGADFGEIVLQTDDPGDPTLRIAFKGNDGPCIRFASPQTAGTSIEFPAAAADEESRAELILSSCGNQPLVIEDVELAMSSDARFSVSNAEALGFPVTLAPKPAGGDEERIVVDLLFGPLSSEPGVGQLVIRNNDARFPSGIALRLVGPRGQ